MEEDSQVFCVDCARSLRQLTPMLFCTAPEYKSIDPVYGTPRYKPCFEVRSIMQNKTKCRQFKPKPKETEPAVIENVMSENKVSLWMEMWRKMWS